MLICVNGLLGTDAQAEGRLIFKAACLSLAASLIGIVYFSNAVSVWE